MSAKSWLGKALLGLAYATPALVLAIYVSFVSFDIPLPLLSSSESEHGAQHIHEGPGTPPETGTGASVGTIAPYFELELEDGTTLTLTDILEQGRPTFLYFWATT